MLDWEIDQIRQEYDGLGIKIENRMQKARVEWNQKSHLLIHYSVQVFWNIFGQHLLRTASVCVCHFQKQKIVIIVSLYINLYLYILIFHPF